jgi:hypothetical protein
MEGVKKCVERLQVLIDSDSRERVHLSHADHLHFIAWSAVAIALHERSRFQRQVWHLPRNIRHSNTERVSC